MYTVRFASAGVARRLPLAVSGDAAWRPAACGVACDVELPVLESGDIVVPSLALGRTDAGHRVDFVLGDTVWPLAPVGAFAASSGPPADERARTHIDYVSVHARIEGARLRFETSALPVDYLLTVSVRPERIVPETGSATSRRLVVPALSQLSAPRTIRRRICSPTCVAMVLAYFERAAPLASIVRDCYHTESGIYGVWPLSVRAAARRGVLGAVEALDSLDAVAALLANGTPVVASIRFADGALEGAPLRCTHGHLVVVTGLDADLVHVNDPASPQLSDVPRSYDRDAFAAAWLTARGAAYVFCRPDPAP
jgi:hypothetical protein